MSATKKHITTRTLGAPTGLRAQRLAEKSFLETLRKISMAGPQFAAFVKSREKLRRGHDTQSKEGMELDRASWLAERVPILAGRLLRRLDGASEREISIAKQAWGAAVDLIEWQALKELQGGVGRVRREERYFAALDAIMPSWKSLTPAKRRRVYVWDSVPTEDRPPSGKAEANILARYRLARRARRKKSQVNPWSEGFPQSSPDCADGQTVD